MPAKKMKARAKRKVKEPGTPYAPPACKVKTRKRRKPPKKK